MSPSAPNRSAATENSIVEKTDPDPVLMIRTGRALLAAKKPDEAITYFQKVMDSADAPAQIKSIAQADRVRAMQAKGTLPAPGAAAPAAPTAK